ncbi:xanthine dehydrogenase accessory protein XdhC [Bauldia sp.]|uniref:xanthine dehydrogenase accessory protein XdhC n=1 Tax=Bauldia sp. TaxID=2575872 RepID=UPI003BA91C1D
MAVWRRLLEMLDSRGRAAMVTVAETRGSSPREPGARMIVNDDGTFTGTIGGGTLEWQAIALAQAALANGNNAELRRFALGPELGQCCGGQVALVIEVFNPIDRADIAHLADLEERGGVTTHGRFVDRPNLERTAIGDPLPPGAAALSEAGVIEGFGDTRRPIALFGAGHVGKALVLALAPLPFRVLWFDLRPDIFPSHVPPNATIGTFEDPDACVAGLPGDSFVLVMTHSHQLDLALVHAALVDHRLGYVGLIGSKSKRARFEKRLTAAGIPRERIDALVCPIGVSGIASKEPAVIAAATAAQLIARDEAVRAMSGDTVSDPLGRVGSMS